MCKTTARNIFMTRLTSLLPCLLSIIFCWFGSSREWQAPALDAAVNLPLLLLDPWSISWEPSVAATSCLSTLADPLCSVHTHELAWPPLLCMCLYVCAIEKTSTISWNIRKMSDKMAITWFPNWQLWQEKEKSTKMLTNRNFLLKTTVSVLQFQPALPQFLQQMED